MRRVIDQMQLREITNTYGLTESSPAMCMTGAREDCERRVRTVGRALPGVEVKILGPGGEELPPARTGEICCRGYNVMQGYYRMPEETAAAIDSLGFLHSGDLGRMDAEGYVSVTGRIKDLIIKGGENISPRELEEFLSGMEGVLDVQIVGAPSRRYGEEVAAFIIPRPGRVLRPEAVREFCRGRIAWHKVPRYVHFLEAYPLTASGKTQKFKLREMAAALFPEAMR
jgi:fatty-acyl-CoA synthase